MPLPEVPGVLSVEQAAATGDWIASVQLPSGAIPWFPGGHVDPWDHVQAAMGLTVAGHADAAARAFGWLADAQADDGTWAAKYVDGEVVEDHVDANFCAYVAVGALHHHRVTGDDAVLARTWPVVRAAIDAVLSLQADDGTVRWARSADGSVADESLLTGNASIHMSLRCAIALAGVVGVDVPEWQDAAARLRHALDEHPERFSPRGRHAMDWYYPVLGGALHRDDASVLLDKRWDEFVVDGLGIRCVHDHPWVTGAETCELVLALDAAGRRDDAVAMLAAMQHLRDDDGSYWTGLVYADGKRWPVETSTWTAATVLLAADALSRTTGANGLFRGEGLLAAHPGDELADFHPEEPCPCLAS